MYVLEWESSFLSPQTKGSTFFSVRDSLISISFVCMLCFAEKSLEMFLGDSRNRNCSLRAILQSYGKLDKNALLYKGLIKGFLPSIFCSRSLSVVVFCSLSVVVFCSLSVVFCSLNFVLMSYQASVPVANLFLMK
jgi:hypothetical protein